MKPYVESGELIALGVVQEQHPDRTRLYRQWRQLDWPIFVDSMNTIDHVTVVPIPMAIDESGIVVDAEFGPKELDAFMKAPRKYAALEGESHADPGAIRGRATLTWAVILRRGRARVPRFEAAKRADDQYQADSPGHQCQTR